MIPKIIHYCWFGGKPKPDGVKNFIDSWRKYCPDYEIREWNESNFNINENDYCREAYESQKWAFVVDYARLVILYRFGGIYMDTDVEIIKSFNPLLQLNGFMCFEDPNNVSIGTLGVVKHSKLVKDFLSAYKHRHFYKSDGGYDTTTNLKIITQVLTQKYHLCLNGKEQIVGDNVKVFPREVFIAKSVNTGWITADDTTFAIHHYAGSWLSDEDRKLGERQSYYLRKYMTKLEYPLSKLARYRSTYDLYGMKIIWEKAIKHFCQLVRINRR